MGAGLRARGDQSDGRKGNRANGSTTGTLFRFLLLGQGFPPTGARARSVYPSRAGMSRLAIVLGAACMVFYVLIPIAVGLILGRAVYGAWKLVSEDDIPEANN